MMIGVQRVLVIDDEPEVTEVHRRCIKHIGAEAVIVPTGSQGREAALREKFPIIMVDLKLPDGSGTDVCEAIWKARPDQAIVVVSGSAYEDDKRLHRATAILLKPFEIPALVDTLKAILKAQAEGKPIPRFGFINPPLG
jgi:DNA-binding response OmpR family regulator